LCVRRYFFCRSLLLAAAPASIGSQASVTQAGGVALGANSSATRGAEAAGTTVVYNSGALRIMGTHGATEQAAISVGAAGSERQITNVADASQGTDAVNLRQLQGFAETTNALISSVTNVTNNLDSRITDVDNRVSYVDNRVTVLDQQVVKYDANQNGSVNYNSVTLGGGKSAGPVALHNIADGVAPNDAVNKSQLDSQSKKLHAGIAAAVALEAAPMVPGKLTSYAGVGYSGGQTALGVTLRRTAESGRWSITGGVVGSSNGVVGRIGVANVWD
jgi:autotransporter adhesin